MTVPPQPDHEPPDDEQEPSFLDELRAALLDTKGLDDIPTPQPLIKGIINRDSLVWLQGKPGDGKSFVALDMAGCVGTGTFWQSLAVEIGDVLYLVAEGASGMRWRVRAWEESMGGAMVGVQWLPRPVQADLLEQWDALIQLAMEIRPALIVLDTQARCTVGMEENSAMDMGRFVERLERLRKASKACVLVVHHQSRNGENLRGSTALEGAATTILKVVKDESEITLSCPKQKDGEPFDDIKLRLVPTADSAVLMLSDGVGPKRSGAAMKTARKWWQVFRDERVSVSKLQKANVAAERSLYRHIRELSDDGLVAKQELASHTFYRLTRDPDGT